MNTYVLNKRQFDKIRHYLTGIMFHRRDDEYSVRVGKHSKYSNDILNKVGAKKINDGTREE